MCSCVRGTCAVVLAILLASAATAQDSWVGRIIVTKRDGIKISHTDEGGNVVEVAKLVENKYQVLEEQEGWIKVKTHAVVSGWFSKDDAVPITQAIDYFTDRIRENPSDWLAFNRRALTWHFHRADLNRALADYDETLRLNPRQAGMFNNRGLVWQSRNDFDRALADLDESLRLNPRHAIVFRNRAGVWLAKKDYDRAIADSTEAIRLEPRFAMAYYVRGLARYRSKDYDSAISDYSEAIRLDPERVNPYNARGQAWYALKRYDQAISDFEEAIRHDPQAKLAHFLLATTLRTTKVHDRALSELDQAIRLDPKYALAYQQRGNIFRELKQYERALDDYGATIRLESAPVVAYSLRGLTWFLLGECEKALEDFDRGERSDPRSGYPYLQRARLLATCSDARHRDGPRALEQIRKAEERFKVPNAQFCAVAAAVHAENGNFEEAIRWQERVLQDPASRDDPEALQQMEAYRRNQPYRQPLDHASTRPTVPSPGTPAPAPPPTTPQPILDLQAQEFPGGSASVATELQKLQGTWVCVSTRKHGKAVNDFVGVRAVITGNDLTWYFPQKDGSYRETHNRFGIDPSRNPKHFDWWRVTDAGKSSADLRLYAVEGDTLRWATNLDYRTRPESVSAAVWQFTMKRQPPAK